MCKDKDFMRTTFHSCWCYVGEPEVSVGYLVELEWFFGRQKKKKCVASKSLMFILDNLEG